MPITLPFLWLFNPSPRHPQSPLSSSVEKQLPGPLMRWKVLGALSTGLRHRGFICACWRQSSGLGGRQERGRRNDCGPQIPRAYPPSPTGLGTDFKTQKRGFLPPHTASTTDGRILSILPDTLHVEANTCISAPFLTRGAQQLTLALSVHQPLRGAHASPSLCQEAALCCLSGPLSRTLCCV